MIKPSLKLLYDNVCKQIEDYRNKTLQTKNDSIKTIREEAILFRKQTINNIKKFN